MHASDEPTGRHSPPGTKRLILLLLTLIAALALSHVRGQAAAPTYAPAGVLSPGSVEVARIPQNLGAVNAAQHWAALMCKFADVGAEPQTASFFDDMFERTSGPSLSDFWQEVSYGHIPSVTAAAHGWFTLPHGRGHYNFSETTAGYDVAAIVQDCVVAADASVDFSPYDAVAVFLNSPSPVAITSLYPVAYPDGAQIQLGAITIPSNKFNLALVAHEMGHAYFLPHSFANGEVYKNPWDLMGIASGYRCSENADPIYSCLGQHTIAHYKDQLGWIAPAQKFEAPQGQSTITLERLALPQSDNYLMATIATDAETYVVEARQRVGYDAKLAADAVIIHRGGGDNLVDADGSPYDDEGARWLPGETYTDEGNGISISVDEATATGFVITINNENTPPQALSATLHQTPAAPVAGERVDFMATIIYQEANAGVAPNLMITVTFPSELNHIPGSAQTSQGTIVGQDPVVVDAGSLFAFSPLFIQYSATVDGAVTAPLLIEVPLQIRWDGGALSTAHTFIVNAEETYLPLLSK